MKHTTNNHFQVDNQATISLTGGIITVQDNSDCSVSVFIGNEALNNAIAKHLPFCDRSTQERFMQVLTDHIRKTDNVEAQ
jgi:urate oxidase